MKRGFLALTLVLLAGVLTAAITYGLQSHKEKSPQEWLQREFSLNDEQAAKVAQIEAAYQKTCMEMCARIAQTDIKIQSLVRSDSAVTPEITQAIAETDQVRTECRILMLKHFYAIAEELPQDQRQRYLDIVLPVVLHPGEMKHEPKAHQQ